jgi:putative tricarboxylic transport membrane protein
MPIIIVLSVVGAYAINNSVADIYYMMGFGIFGYFLKLYHFPSAPMILGVILSQLVEQNYRRGVSMVGNNLIAFIIDLFANPISIVLIIMIGLMLITQSKFWINFREKREKAKDIKISE